jgi:hypothetical protein
MKAEISTEFGKDPEYDKVISINHGSFTIEDWVATLSIEDQNEWRQQHAIHEAAVHSAIAAGDALIVKVGDRQSNIKWRNEEIHLYWMHTISAEDHVSYQSFWTRYRAAMTERNT